MNDTANDPPPGELMVPADVGLFDAVRTGWFKPDGELFPGFKVGPGDVAADVGCGLGPHTRYCATHGARVIFTDAVAERVDGLMADLPSFPAGSTGFVSDSVPLPIADGECSHVICTEVLEHVDDPAAVMAELARIGRPGAVYLISAPDKASEDLLRPVALPDYFQKPNHIRVFTRQSLVQLVEGGGLSIRSCTPQGFFWSFGLAAHWALCRADGLPIDRFLDVGKDSPQAVHRWARLWWEMLQTPGFEPVRDALNAAIPRNNVIIAEKPG